MSSEKTPESLSIKHQLPEDIAKKMLYGKWESSRGKSTKLRFSSRPRLEMESMDVAGNAGKHPLSEAPLSNTRQQNLDDSQSNDAHDNGQWT